MQNYMSFIFSCFIAVVNTIWISERVRYSQSPTTGKQQYYQKKKKKEEPCWPLEVTAYRSTYGNKKAQVG
jgi:hypothetical protein